MKVQYNSRSHLFDTPREELNRVWITKVYRWDLTQLLDFSCFCCPGTELLMSILNLDVITPRFGRYRWVGLLLSFITLVIMGHLRDSIFWFWYWLGDAKSVGLGLLLFPSFMFLFFSWKETQAALIVDSKIFSIERS
jgi:hypothetical protein